jgi:O-acetyl-ADP-ribose deacetylase (regulator of RNase III)
VVHTVGPIWGSDEPAAQLLGSCYRRAIEIVDAEGLQSISFPAISTGAYGYPRDRAARVASKAIAEALGKAHAVRTVHLVFFSDSDRLAFEQHQQFP